MKPSSPISSSTSNILNLKAAPKCISGSTSYFSVWLAFHPYPQFIQKLFNVYWFGPPSRFNMTSTWSWVDHKVSRLPPLTEHPIQIRFRFGSIPSEFNLASEEQLVGSLCKRHAVIHCWTPTACKRMVSGTISLRCSRFFSPFPHGTCSLSVSRKYLALPDGPGDFWQDFSCPAILRILPQLNILRLRGYHPLWPNFPDGSTSCFCLKGSPITPSLPKQWWFGLFPVRSPLLWKSLFVFFSSRYLDVSVRGVSSHCWVTGLQPAGLPHSEIIGSMVICTSPKLIAAYHVLLRLLEPRHPPYALSYFL